MAHARLHENHSAAWWTFAPREKYFESRVLAAGNHPRPARHTAAPIRGRTMATAATLASRDMADLARSTPATDGCGVASQVTTACAGYVRGGSRPRRPASATASSLE
jgi:hypothetical protein